MLNKVIFNIPTTDRPSDKRRRYIKKVDDDNKTISIGSLHLDYNMQDDNEKIYEKLKPNEITQCKEFVKIYNKMRRCKKDTTNQSFKAQTIYWDEGFANMLYEISERAETKGLSFFPKDIMFEGLLKRLGDIEEKLELGDIFEKYLFQTTYKGALLKIQNSQRQALIKEFLATDEDSEHLMLLFNDHLRDCYDVEKVFTYQMLEDLISNPKERAIRSYVMSACIDVMSNYGVNPCENHDAGMVFYYWYNVRLSQMNSHKAVKQFTSEFSPNDEEMDKVYIALTDLISKPSLPNHISTTL